ncbi:MAG TPA: DNA-3-methyladenine glycosylase I [Candidatus Saccharimonadales bacterium]|nr:DNA-3-methyladenine glycosylase I [Candidatus Saccharimonadales bacterium]
MLEGPETSLVRCAWCGDHELYVAYHDHEWGVPLHDDRQLFELLVLEGAQAGLSWLTILKKRDNYRKTFNNFTINEVAAFGDREVASLLADPGIIRNRLKIASAIQNAQVVVKIQREFGSLDAYLWQCVDGKPIQHSYTKLSQLPAVNDIAIKLSSDLKKRGMNFVGPTICYAFMQSSGMVNDHLISCFRYEQLKTEV